MAKRKSEFKEMTMQDALVGMIFKKTIHQVMFQALAEVLQPWMIT